MKSLRLLALSSAVVALSLGCGDKSPAVNTGDTVPVIGQVLPPRGPTTGGTVALIRGLNFKPGTTVAFGSETAVAVKVVSATTLVVETPAGGAGAVDVVVTGPEGKASTFKGGFTYYEKDGTTAPEPTLSGIAPPSGPAEGGTVALVTGGAFQDGALLFVGRSPASDVVFIDEARLSGVLPPNDVGPANVEVTNPDGQTAKLSEAFSYYAEDGVGPNISAVSPVAGTTAGGTDVGVSGTGFKPGAIVFFGGRPAVVLTTNQTGISTQTPAGAPGVVDVAVTNPDGRSSILRGGYNYYIGGPVISAITPNFGPPDGGTNVTITGRAFNDQIVASIGGRSLANFRRIDDRTLAGTTQGGPAGEADVYVQNDDGQSDTLVNGFNYGVAPPTTFSIARVTPEVGPVSGGTRVTVIGSGFDSSATVLFGTQPATGIQVVGGATISAVTPAGSIGPVNVSVTQGSTTKTLDLGFWYFDPSLNGPKPSIANVTPALGPQTGGTTVLITGGGFVQGARVFFGSRESTDATVVTGSTMTATTAAADAVGPVDVRVQNPDGQVATMSQGFVFVDPSTLSAAPALTSVTPNTGGSADDTDVVIAGQNVQQGALVFVGGVPATGVTIGTGTVDATFGPHDPGVVDVVVTNPDGQSGRLPSSFTYTRSPPTLTSLTPNTVPLAGGLKVLLSGKGFVAGATVSVDGVQAAATFVDSTLLFITSPAHAAGAVDVVVTNPDSQSSTLSGGLTYADIQLGNSPTVTSIAPLRGPHTGGTVALVVGTNFAQGARVLFGSQAATNVTVMSDTRLSAVVPPNPPGLVDLTLVNPDGQSAQLLQAFTYVDRATLGPGPQLASVTPATGVAAGGTQTVLTGSGFQQGMLVFYGGFSAAAAAVQNGGIATATTPAGPSGLVDVAITNPDGLSSVLVGGFRYTAQPQPQTIFPDEGPTAGGASFTLAGAGFAPGARVYFGTVEAVGAMVQSSTVIVGTTPAQVAGTVDVRVVNPDGQAGTLTGGFTYNAAPVVALARPGAGPVTGGTTLLVTGTGFRAGAAVTVGGAAATNVRVVSATELYAVTPAGVPGATSVVVTNPDTQSSSLAGGFRYDLIDAVAQRATTFPDVVVPMVRDDAQYTTDLGVVNLSGAPVNVTIASHDGAGIQLASRALSTAVPPFGRVVVPDVLQFAEAVTTSTGRTASVSVSADGPVSAYGLITDAVSGDASLVLGETTARAAARVLIPYASSVGAFKTWVGVRNVGTSAATVTITARDAAGAQVGQLTALTVAANGQYSSDDVLGAMGVTGQTATLEVSAAGAQLLAASRTSSNARLGAWLWGRPASDAALTQTLAWVPDTSTDTSSIYLFNTDSTGSASVTIDLKTALGQSLGTRQFTVPASGFVQVPDLARTLLGRTNPTQTQGTAHITSDKKVVATLLALTTANSDLRMVGARPGGGVRHLLPAADPHTSLSVVNVGTAAANIEVSLTVDSGAPRGVPVKVAVAPGASFQAPLLLTSLGAGTSNGMVEVRSTNGMPLVAVARVSNETTGLKGDAVDLGNLLTLPTLDSITPNSGPAAGGTFATVRGEHLLPGVNFLFGATPAPRAATYDDSTAVVVSPAGTAGNVEDLTAINFDGSTFTLPMAFSFINPSLLGPPPVVASVQPTQVSTLGGTALQINGSDFVSQAKAYVGLRPVAGAVQVNPSRVDGAAPSGPIGPADVTVTNPDGQSSTLTDAVLYVVPPPAVTGVTPNSGPGAGGTTVRLSGSGFQVGATVGFGTRSAPVVTVLSSGELEAVTPSGNDGPVAVTVINPDGQSTVVNNGFTYVAAPTVAQVSPTSGPTMGGTNITLTGTYFRTGATVLLGTDACTNVNVLTGGTTITCTTPAAATAGPVAVRVTNGDGQYGVLNNAFTYLAPVPPPTVTAVSPSFGPITGGTQVTVQGSNFQAGATVKFGTTNSTAVTIVSPSALVAMVPGGAAIGAVSVTVTNPDTQFGVLSNAFTYYQPADLPGIAITLLAPSEGPTAGGTPVFVSGQGFRVGVTVTFGGVASPSVTYLGPSALLATTPAHAPGNVNVTATNPDATSSTLVNGFNFTNGVLFLPPPMRLPLTNERGYEMAKLFDYDGDGDLDAYLARRRISCDSGGDDELWVNDGTGTFTRLTTFPGDNGRITITGLVADFDANGTRDLFVLPDTTSGGNPANAASFYKNYPLGVFTRADVGNLAGTAVQNRGAAVADLNNDGFPDIYVASAGADYMYLNNQNGTFTATRTGLPGVVDDSRAACAADFDKDGDDDVLVINASNQQANYYLQGPSGVFTLSNALIPVVGGTGVGCTVGEFRPGTGILDVVVVRDGQVYQYLRNDGTGRFTDEAATLNIYRLPPVPPSLRIGYPSVIGSQGGVEPLDVDGDGDLDLVMHHLDLDPRMQIYLNDGAGFFTLGTASRVPSQLAADQYLAIGDVNSDGRPDVLAPGGASSDQPRLMLGGPGGTFTYRTMKTIPESNFCAQDAVAFDADGDGDEDLVSVSGCRENLYQSKLQNQEPVSCRTETVHYWVNDGIGGFTDVTAARFPAFNLSATAVTAGDVDGDGDLDLVIGTTGVGAAGGSSRDASLRLYLNDGNGVFTDGTYPRLPVGEFNFFTVVALFDIDKDGKLDLYALTDEYSCTNSQQRLYLNTGNGYYFNVSGQLPYNNFPNVLGGCDAFHARGVSTADFNGDTYLDLYVVANGRNRLLLNQGGLNPGFFTDYTASNVPNVSDNSRAVVAADLNNDGFPDLFTCNNGVDTIDLGNATGVLSDVTATNWPVEAQPYPYPAVCGGNNAPINSNSCTLADVDDDGDIDVVVAGSVQGNLKQRDRLYINAGNANFVDKTNVSMPYDTADTEKVLLFDANGDNKPDLFIGACNQPYVYLNQ